MKYYFVYYMAIIALRFKTDMKWQQIKYVAEQIAYFKTKM